MCTDSAQSEQKQQRRCARLFTSGDKCSGHPFRAGCFNVSFRLILLQLYITDKSVSAITRYARVAFSACWGSVSTPRECNVCFEYYFLSSLLLPSTAVVRCLMCMRMCYRKLVRVQWRRLQTTKPGMFNGRGLSRMGRSMKFPSVVKHVTLTRSKM